MSGRGGGPEGRVAGATASVVRYLNHLEAVCGEEDVTMPAKVVHALAVLRVWCRDTGREHRAKQPRP